MSSYEEYSKEKSDFVKAHGGFKSVETSPIDEYDQYHKLYVCEDGAQWYETMRPYYENKDVEVKGITINLSFKLLEVEYWDSVCSISRTYYEPYQ